VKDLEKLTGRQWNYKQLMDSAAKLRSQEVLLRLGKNQLQVGLLASVEYLDGQGCVELELSEKIRPYLVGLQRNFTSFRLQAVLRLTSKRAKRIYQLVSQWKNQSQTPFYPINELKTILGLNQTKRATGEKYQKISTLRKFVLDVAVQQINEHTELAIRYELKKEGCSFKAVSFTIERQKLLAIAESSVTERLHLARQKLAELEIRDSRLVTHILSEDTFVEELLRFSYSLKTGKIKAARNPGGLFLTIIGLREAKPKAVSRAA
jgi:plasmid replication initiation protein